MPQETRLHEVSLQDACLHETCLPKIAHGTTEHERPPRPRLLDASTPKKGDNWAHAPVKNYDYCTQAPTTMTKTPQDAPRNLRKLYENPPGHPRKPQEAPGSPRRSQEPKQAIKNVLQIWAARAQCTNALAADLSVITKVNVLEIRAARARCTKALVAELSGITMCCNYGQPKPNARIPSHNHKHTITHTHRHTHTHKHTHTHPHKLSLSHRSNTKCNPVQHVSSIQGEETHTRRHTTRTTHTHTLLSPSLVAILHRSILRNM